MSRTTRRGVRVSCMNSCTAKQYSWCVRVQVMVEAQVEAAEMAGGALQPAAGRPARS